MIALQSCFLLPYYAEATGIMIADPANLMIVQRFALLGTAVCFVFSSLLFMGANMPRISLNIAAALVACAFLSYILPVDMNPRYTLTFTTGKDQYIHLAAIAFYTASALTYVTAIAKDRATHSIKRGIASILLLAGSYASLYSSLIVELAACLIYIPGIVLFIASSRDSF